jgi:hypothetical protein
VLHAQAAVAAQKAAEGCGEARRNETRSAHHPQARQRQYLQTSNPALRRMVRFLAFSLFFSRGAEEWRVDFTQRRVK